MLVLAKMMKPLQVLFVQSWEANWFIAGSGPDLGKFCHQQLGAIRIGRFGGKIWYVSITESKARKG